MEIIRNNTQPKVSVIVPSYNMEEYIRVCLDSLCEQTLLDVEIIVVDDGSKDTTVSIVEELVRSDSRIVLKKLPANVGTFLARMEGMKAARGAYVCTVDADDWVSPEFLYRLYETAERASADIVECGLRVVRSNGRYACLPCVEQSPEKAAGANIVEQVLQRKIWHIAANKIFRRDLVNQSLPFLESIRERIVIADDKLLTFPFFYFANSFVRIPDRLYFYRIRLDSATNNRVLEHDIKHIHHTFLVDKNIKDFLAAQNAPSNIQKLADKNRGEEVLLALRNLYHYPPDDNIREVLVEELFKCYGRFAFASLIEAHEYASVMSNTRLAQLKKKELLRVIYRSLLQAVKAIRVLVFPPSR